MKKIFWLLVFIAATTLFPIKNVVAQSSYTKTIIVITPVSEDLQVPTTPTNLTVSTISSSQINLIWSSSSDNIGVVGYEIFRNGVSIAKITTTSFGDGSLSPATSYTYSIKAYDAAGNYSTFSKSATAATKTTPVTKAISGTIYSSTGGTIPFAKINLTATGLKKTFYANSNGQYYMINLPQTIYSLTYSAANYLNQKTTINIAAGVNNIKDITLIRR